MEIKVLVCDDQALVRAGIRAVLAAEPDIAVVAEVADPYEAQRATGRIEPDVAIIGGRDATGRIALIASLVRARPTAPAVLIVGPPTGHPDGTELLDVLRAGARGWVSMDRSPCELVHAVRAVAGGGAVLTPAATRQVIELAMRPVPDDCPLPAAVSRLSPRELTVLELVAGGLSGGEVARRLHVSEATVRSHVHHILTKLDLRNRAQAVAFAYRYRLVGLDGPAGSDAGTRAARPIAQRPPPRPAHPALHESGARKSIVR
jgi:DNA-binding NarL/FixJ family response regulator